MTRISLLLLAVIMAALTFGCGGNGNQQAAFAIRDTGFDPPSRTVHVGDEVAWANAGSQTHSVVSGTLEPRAVPVTVDVGVLNNQFTIEGITVRLGDNVRFQNLSNLPVQIEVKDQQLNDVFLTPVLLPNETAVYKTTIGGAGVFILKDTQNPAVTTTLTVVGLPNPNGIFNSSPLAPGQQFRFTFTNSGQFPFFDGITNAAVGTVIVQP